MNKLTVMMNCMNGEKYLPEALQNIINQSFKNWELYFFDNQSSDNSKEKLLIVLETLGLNIFILMNVII